MNGALWQFGLTAFVTLLVVVDPFGVVPIFAGLTRGMSAAERRSIVIRAVIISLVVTIFFLLAGRAVLSHLGVTVHAFGISGGILLFGQRPGLQAPERDEHGTAGEDIAIFPLAIPLLSGPGTIATVLLLSTQTGGGASSLTVLAAAILIVYLIALVVLRRR